MRADQLIEILDKCHPGTQVHVSVMVFRDGEILSSPAVRAKLVPDGTKDGLPHLILVCDKVEDLQLEDVPPAKP